jgi:hypothetical protein
MSDRERLSDGAPLTKGDATVRSVGNSNLQRPAEMTGPVPEVGIGNKVRFQNDPLLAYLKLNLRQDWEGGSLIQENFVKCGRSPKVIWVN